MITKEEVLELLKSTEKYRVERTISTTDMDKFCEAICAFSNDLPGSRKKGYLILGAYDNGTLCGLKVTDSLQKKIAAIRSDGNILPLPVMSVEPFEYPEGDLLVAEVSPSMLPPVRYRGRTFIRIGPRRDIASEAEERILMERRMAFLPSFDSMPCMGSSMKDLDIEKFTKDYLPKAIDPDVLSGDDRPLTEQMSSLGIYDLSRDCPTFAALILFGKNTQRYMPGNYIQYVQFAGEDEGSDVISERTFRGPLASIIPEIEKFLDFSVSKTRPVPVPGTFRDAPVTNYPYLALRELVMNACMHRDYQSTAPVRLYQFRDRVEVVNSGGLFGDARPENFPTKNAYRNPLVAEGMRVLGFVNKFNRGIKRVREQLEANGSPAAIYRIDQLTHFEAIVYSADPLENPAVKAMAGQATDQAAIQVTGQATGQATGQVQRLVSVIGRKEVSAKELMDKIGLKGRDNFLNMYLLPALGGGFIEQTHPDKPRHPNQKYRLTAKGKSLL